MDRYFRRISSRPVGISTGKVSIHLLWTGTLEVFIIIWVFVVVLRFNPSFMDRYFRSVRGYLPRDGTDRFNPSFMDRYFRRVVLLKSVFLCLKAFQSIFYGQVL